MLFSFSKLRFITFTIIAATGSNTRKKKNVNPSPIFTSSIYLIPHRLPTVAGYSSRITPRYNSFPLAWLKPLFL